MKHKHSLWFSSLSLVITSMLLSLVNLAYANDDKINDKQVKINWHEPDNFRDVRSPDGGQKRYRENVFRQLDKHFQKTAKKYLPEGFVLNVKVTELDLAGDTRFYTGGINNYRVLNDVHWPRIEFEYELYEGNELVNKEAVKLKDMSYLHRIGLRSQSESFHYDKRLITEWFKDDVPDLLTFWQKQKTAIMSE